MLLVKEGSIHPERPPQFKCQARLPGRSLKQVLFATKGDCQYHSANLDDVGMGVANLSEADDLVAERYFVTYTFC